MVRREAERLILESLENINDVLAEFSYLKLIELRRLNKAHVELFEVVTEFMKERSPGE